jgi:Ricin-type beta-trefoil lectin domain-like
MPYPTGRPRSSRSRRARAAVAAALACVAAVAVAGTAAGDVIFDKSPPTTGVDRTYIPLLALHSGLGLNVPEATTTPGTPIIQWSGGMTSMNGQWEILYAKGTPYIFEYSIRNRWSRQCLTVDSKQPGPVVQRPCDGRPSQVWTFTYSQSLSNYATVTNAWSGLDLNISGGSKELGAQLIQWYHSPDAPNALFRTKHTKIGVDAVEVTE